MNLTSKMVRGIISAGYVFVYTTCLMILGGCGVLDQFAGSNAENLLVSVSSFRAGTTSKPSGPFALRGAREVAGSTFYWKGAYFANQVIFRYSIDKGAKEKYQDLRYSEFRDDLYSTPWLVPAELPYQSPVASEFHLACITWEEGKACKAIARYGKYVSQFSTNIASEFMRLVELGNVLRAIDERAATVLGIPLPTRTP